MKSIAIIAALLSSSVMANAVDGDYRMNPFTGKPDYYQTGIDSATVADIAASTTSLAAQTAALDSSTQALAGRTSALEVSTATLDATLAAEILVRQALSTEVASDTSTLETSKISEPTVEGSNGDVLITDGSGGRTWGPMSGSGVSLDDFNIWQSTNIFNSILMSTGTHGSGDDLAAAGAGSRFFFYPKKSAIRGGQVTGTAWDDANIGNQSVGFGTNCTASAQYTNCVGNANSATYYQASAFGGSGNSVSGHSAFAGGGEGNTVSGGYSSVIGSNNSSATGSWSGIVSGANNVASGNWSIGLGGNNLTISGLAGGAGGQWVQNAGDYSFVWGNYVGLSAAADGSMLFGYDTSSVKTYTESGKFYIHGLDLRVSSSTTAAVKYGLTKEGVATVHSITATDSVVASTFTATSTATLAALSVTGAAAFAAPAQFNAVAASTPSVTNATYKANMVGAWLNYNGVAGSITAGFNIAAVTKTGTGDYTVFFANDFASTAYVCLCSTGRAESDDYGDCVVQGAPASGGSITVATYDNSTTKVDRARVFMICVGAQ